MPIYTHDFVDLESGLMVATGILHGSNAIQSITVGRHTPKQMQQAVGYLGVVDFTRGIITSDVSIDVVITEQTEVASANTSVYKYALQSVDVGLEEYVLTNVSISFTAGNPATATYGFLTASIASTLAMLAEQSATVRHGEEDPFAVVVGDDASGIAIAATGGGEAGDGVTILDTDGSPTTIADGNLPAGLQSLNFNARINRDNVLDVRSVLPVQFVTTYPIDISADLEVYQVTDRTAYERFDTLVVSGGGQTGETGQAGGWSGQIVQAIDLSKVDESETMAVGRYRAYTFNYTVADLQVPLDEPPAATLD